MSATRWIARATTSALIVTLVCNCGRVAFETRVDANVAGDVAVPSEYAYRKRITLSHPSAVSDLPVSIVTLDAELALHAHPSGTDLAFFDAALQPLAHEVVAYDSAAGALECWVHVPSLSAGTTELYLYYGGPTRTNDPTAVWKGYAGVWHMSGMDTERDSTSNANLVEPFSDATRPASVVALVGRGREFDGVDDTMDVPDPSDGSLDFGTSSFSYGVVVFVAQSVGNFDMPLHKGGQSTLSPGYDLELGMFEWNPCVGDGVATRCEASHGQDADLAGGWVSVVTVVDRARAELRAYTSGTLAGTTSIPTLGSVDNPDAFFIGDETFVFRGVVDEVWVMHGALDDAAVAARHVNIAARDSFVVVGPEQQR